LQTYIGALSSNIGKILFHLGVRLA
jgi:hypothetical protein